MLIINIQAKSVYGQTKLYPVGPAATALATIAGTKTLEPRVLREAVEGLGARVVFVGENRDTNLAAASLRKAGVSCE